VHWEVVVWLMGHGWMLRRESPKKHKVIFQNSIMRNSIFQNRYTSHLSWQNNILNKEVSAMISPQNKVWAKPAAFFVEMIREKVPDIPKDAEVEFRFSDPEDVSKIQVRWCL
jgi:hypothetical protein